MSNKNFNVPRGTVDILPDDIAAWQYVEQKAREIFQARAYREIRTPAFEDTSLFSRSLGTATDIVQKQMLNLEKKNLSLRPEGTASVVRSYVENSMYHQSALTKLFYLGPMFRGERPQKGRLRQFHHIGAEAIGLTHPYLDVEMISLSIQLLKAFRLEDFELKINSLGSSDDKKNLAKVLKQHLKKELKNLCCDCRDRFERNIFRILDCKKEACKFIVSRLELGADHLSEKSRQYFEQVLKGLDTLKIPYRISSSLVRGLDYYTHTVYEISHASLGSQDALGAGGRYDQLVVDLGGPEVGAVGFALGVERILLAGAKDHFRKSFELDVYLIALSDLCFEKIFLLADALRKSGISADISYRQGSIKSQMRQADKSKAKWVILMGEDELKRETVSVKNMETGQQQEIRASKVGEVIKKQLC